MAIVMQPCKIKCPLTTVNKLQRFRNEKQIVK